MGRNGVATYTPEQKQKALDLYKEGKSAEAVATEIGCSAATIYNWTAEAGLRQMGPPKAEPAGLEAEAKRARNQLIVELFEQGLTKQAIAERVGLRGHSAVSGILNAAKQSATLQAKKKNKGKKNKPSAIVRPPQPQAQPQTQLFNSGSVEVVRSPSQSEAELLLAARRSLHVKHVQTTNASNEVAELRRVVDALRTERDFLRKALDDLTFGKGS